MKSWGSTEAFRRCRICSFSPDQPKLDTSGAVK
jgi:hypothetical protein